MHVAVTSGRLFQGIYSQTSVLIFHLVSRDLLQTAPQLQVHYWLPLEAQRKLKTFGYRSHLRKPVVKGESLFTGRCFFFSFLSFLFFLSSSSSFFFFWQQVCWVILVYTALQRMGFTVLILLSIFCSWTGGGLSYLIVSGFPIVVCLTLGAYPSYIVQPHICKITTLKLWGNK